MMCICSLDAMIASLLPHLTVCYTETSQGVRCERSTISKRCVLTPCQELRNMFVHSINVIVNHFFCIYLPPSDVFEPGPSVRIPD